MAESMENHQDHQDQPGQPARETDHYPIFPMRCDLAEGFKVDYQDPAAEIILTIDHPVAGDDCSVFYRRSADSKSCRMVLAELRYEKSDSKEINDCWNIILPRQSSQLELWHTGQGRQIVNEAIPGVGQENAASMIAENEVEALFYSVNPLNCIHFLFGSPGHLAVEKTVRSRPALPGEPPWELDEAGKVSEMAWVLRWEASDPGKHVLVLSQGVQQVATRFSGRFRLELPEATADFGTFFYQNYLGCLPLNLKLVDGFLAPKCNVLTGHVEAYRDVWSRDVAWAYEFLSLLDPAGVGTLVENFIALAIRHSQTVDPSLSPVKGHIGQADSNWGVADYWDDAAAELLILAGLHYRLTGNCGFARSNIEFYHQCAHYLLSLIPQDGYLPITSSTWDGQGALIGVEPYFVSECHAALVQMAKLDQALDNEELAGFWATAAGNIKIAALADYRQGGLWHADRGTFINHIDYKDPALASARSHNWSRSPIQERGIPRLEFMLYETIVPIWLGLMDDEKMIRQAFAWIDSHYDYCSGRAGFTLPPGINQNFMALLDVCVRQKYGIPGADRLLQLILDRASDGGIPLTESAFGSHKKTGPAHPEWRYQFYTQTHAGRTWDNSPYFGLVMSLHYGLDYSFHGWQIDDPKPIVNYGSTRLGGLRHKGAVYNLEWQGHGKISAILLNGQRMKSRQLSQESGNHEVRIILEHQ